MPDSLNIHIHQIIKINTKNIILENLRSPHWRLFQTNPQPRIDGHHGSSFFLPIKKLQTGNYTLNAVTIS